LIQRTARGRVPTDRAWAHLGLEPPRGTSSTPLF
jgi:Holliday junction DNA helicase RuvB